MHSHVAFSQTERNNDLGAESFRFVIDRADSRSSTPAARFKVVVGLISRDQSSAQPELTTGPNVMNLKNSRPICAALSAI